MKSPGAPRFTVHVLSVGLTPQTSHQTLSLHLFFLADILSLLMAKSSTQPTVGSGLSWDGLALYPASCSDQNEASTGTGEVREWVGTGLALCVPQLGQVKQDLCIWDV